MGLMDRFKAFDGLRWWLFIGAFSYHASETNLMPLSYVLPVFFVLSGYLVGKIIFESNWKESKRILRNFYIRRFLRLAPPFLFVIAVMHWLGMHRFGLWTLFQLLHFKIFYLSWKNPAELQAIFQEWRHTEVHMWSLAAEEQVYFVLSLLLFLKKRESWGRVLFGIIVLCIISRLFLEFYAPKLYRGTLLIGVGEYSFWGALLVDPGIEKYLKRWNASNLLTLGLSMVFLLTLSECLDKPQYYQFFPNWRQTPVAIFLALTIWSMPEAKNHWFNRFLSWGPWPFLGRISYSAYLMHMSFLAISYEWAEKFQINPWIFIWGFAFPSIILSASIMWFSFEYKINKLKRYFPM